MYTKIYFYSPDVDFEYILLPISDTSESVQLKC